MQFSMSQIRLESFEKWDTKVELLYYFDLMRENRVGAKLTQLETRKPKGFALSQDASVYVV